MFGNNLEIGAGAIYLIRVTVAAGPAHGHGAGGNEFVQGRAFPVQSDVGPFRLSDLQKIATNSGETNGLRRRSPGVRRGHFFQVDLVHPEKDGRGNQHQCEGTHDSILRLLWAAVANISVSVVSW